MFALQACREVSRTICAIDLTRARVKSDQTCLAQGPRSLHNILRSLFLHYDLDSYVVLAANVCEFSVYMLQ